jgi:hypothetical protein
MYQYIPQKSNRRAMYLVCLFLIGGGLLLFLSTKLKGVIGFIWIFQLIGISFCAASIFIFSRYVSKSYIYAITNEGDLTVTEVQGKRRITVCRLSIASASRIESCEGSETEKINAIKKHIKTEKRKVYNYCIDIVPSAVCYVFSEEFEEVAVIFQPDEKMLDILNSYTKTED